MKSNKNDNDIECIAAVPKLLKNTSKEFNFKDFSNLDESEDADYLIKSMNEIFEIEKIQVIKKRAIKLLNVKKNDRILELGCGLGDDAEVFAKLTGENGKVIAIDASQKMLEQAKKRSCYSNVSYVLGNAANVDYPNESFDICHADRLLISQVDFKGILRESVRLLKKGGRLGITDCDFGSIIFYPFHPEITPILIKRLCEITQNPFIGRQLHTHFKEAGFKEVSIQPEPYVVKSFKKLNSMIDIPRILKDLYYQNLLSKQDITIQLKDFIDAEKKDNFLYAITFFTAIGVKP